MFNKYKFYSSNQKILNFLFFGPILLSIPFFNNLNPVKAGLEFQWDQNSGLRSLRWFQKENGKRARNSIFFFFRPSDRKAELLKINVKIPKTFKSTLKEEKISLCKVLIGGFDTRTRCLENIQADIVLSEDNRSLDIYPYKPIPADKNSYAIVFKVFNPKRSGLYQFHSFGEFTGALPVSNYLGSWTIVID